MTETIQLGDITIAMTRKDIRNVHLSVHPAEGARHPCPPLATRPEVALAYAASKIGWIRDQQAKLLGQARESPRQFVERESHYLWGRRYLLSIVEKDVKPFVRLDHRRITLTVRPAGVASRPAT
jgi:predicted metal-dependent hydrolase